MTQPETQETAPKPAPAVAPEPAAGGASRLRLIGTGLGWLLTAAVAVGLVAAAFAVIWVGLVPGGTESVARRISTWSAGSTAAAGLPASPSDLPGFLSIEPPQVYTRERLVNDRFREATWLNRQLEEADSSDTRASLARAARTRKEAISTQGTLAVGTEAPSAPQAAAEAGATGLDPLDLFQRRLNYRERLRNDLMDTLLDDGHDLEGNTLYRLNFDAVVLPWSDRAAPPGTALFVITARTPYGALDTPAEEQRRIADDIDLLRSWQREIQVFLTEVQTLRHQAFLQQGTLSNPVDPKENIAFGAFLRTRLIETFLRIASKSATLGDCREDETYYAGHPCQTWFGAGSDLSPSGRRNLELRMDDVARWTGFDWRHDLPSPESGSADVVAGLLRALEVAQAVNEVRALSAPVPVLPYGMGPPPTPAADEPPPDAATGPAESMAAAEAAERPDPAAPPANAGPAYGPQSGSQSGPPPPDGRSLRFNPATLRAMSDPEMKRAVVRVLAAMSAMEQALPNYMARDGGKTLPADLGLDRRMPVAPPPGIGAFLQRFGAIVPSPADVLAYRDELETNKHRHLATEAALASDPNILLPPPDLTRPHDICISQPTLFDYGRCMFLRASPEEETQDLLAHFLIARLTNALQSYEVLEQPITAFLDVRLSGCGITGCMIEVRQHAGLTSDTAGLTPFTVYDDKTRSYVRIDPFTALARDDIASREARHPVAKLTLANIARLTELLKRNPARRHDALLCLRLANFALDTNQRLSPEEVYHGCMLRQWIDAKRNDLVVYGVSPRIGGPVAESGMDRALALAVGGKIPYAGGTQIGTATGTRVASARTDLLASVIGFSQMPLGESRTLPDAPLSHAALDEAVFGWAVRPEQAADGVHWSPSHHRLSAVVAVPSWWRWLEFEVEACWLSPQRARAISDTLHADPRGICETAAPGNPALTPTLERVFQVQLPRRVEDVTERFNFDFIKAPYFDRDWDDDVAQNPSMLTMEVGRPGRLLLAGERLWRGTVVTVNNQNADGILVLPDMKGVVAEFRCVHPPPGQSMVVTGPGQIPPPVPVPMLVWTSEGRTQVRLVTLQPFIKRGEADLPCLDKDPDPVASDAPTTR